MKHFNYLLCKIFGHKNWPISCVIYFDTNGKATHSNWHCPRCGENYGQDYPVREEILSEVLKYDSLNSLFEQLAKKHDLSNITIAREK